MDSTMTSRPTATTGLIAHWVPVTDARGGSHLEMQWAAPVVPAAPAPAGAHQHAA